MKGKLTVLIEKMNEKSANASGRAAWKEKSSSRLNIPALKILTVCLAILRFFGGFPYILNRDAIPRTRVGDGSLKVHHFQVRGTKCGKYWSTFVCMLLSVASIVCVLFVIIRDNNPRGSSTTGEACNIVLITTEGSVNILFLLCVKWKARELSKIIKILPVLSEPELDKYWKKHVLVFNISTIAIFGSIACGSVASLFEVTTASGYGNGDMTKSPVDSTVILCYHLLGSIQLLFVVSITGSIHIMGIMLASVLGQITRVVKSTAILQEITSKQEANKMNSHVIDGYEENHSNVGTNRCVQLTKNCGNVSENLPMAEIVGSFDKIVMFMNASCFYFNIPILIIFVQSLASSIGLLFFLTMLTAHWQYKLYAAEYLFVLVVPVVFICHTADVVLDRMEVLRRCLARLQVTCSNEDTRLQAGRLHTYLLECSSWTVGRCFVLTKAQLVKMGSFIATYVVILHQFNGGDVQSKEEYNATQYGHH